MRNLKHPGISGQSQTSVVPATLRKVIFRLETGKTFLAAMQQKLAAMHAASAVAEIHGGSFDPFVYVMPALSKMPEYAVYFSDRHEPKGVIRLIEGCVTFGANQGKPMLHCHARWVEENGQMGCGHLLPHECIIRDPIEVHAWLMDGAQFQVIPDIETNFSLFQPVAFSSNLEETVDCSPGYAIRIGANQDVCETISTICRQRHIENAYFVGGVGSTIGARFTDGSTVEPHVTELYLNSGKVTYDGSKHDVSIDVTMIDYQGGISSGKLLPGDNPVLVTMELVMVNGAPPQA